MTAPLRRIALIGALMGGFVVLLFGGWTPIPVAVVLGPALGLALASQHEHAHAHHPRIIAQVSGLAGLGLLIGGLLYHLVVAPSSGLATTFPPLMLGTRIDFDPFVGALLSGIVAIAVCIGLALVTAKLDDAPPVRRRWNMYGLIAVLAILYPLVLVLFKLDIKWLDPLVASLIFVMPALGLNIVVGYAGLLDLGYVAFFAIGAYGTAFLASNYHGIAWPFFLAIWFAAAITAISGLVLGAPTLPLRGDYLAIVTLGFGEIIPVVFRNLDDIRLVEPLTGMCFLGCTDPFNLTNGVIGINPVFRPILPFVGEFKAGQYLPWYYLLLTLIVLSLFLINRLRDSRLGRAWLAMREDELAAAQMGIDIVHTKLLAFSMGATFAGFAGAFSASYTTFVEPTAFDFSISVIILVMVILGGMGNMTGAIVGALIIGLVDRLLLSTLASVLQGFIRTSILPSLASNAAAAEFLTRSLDPGQFRLLLFGLALVIIMVTRPQGLIPNEQTRRTRQQAPMPDEPSVPAKVA